MPPHLSCVWRTPGCLVFSVQSGLFVYICQVNVKIISFSRQSWNSRWGRCRSLRNILEERMWEPVLCPLPNTVERTWGGQMFQDSTVVTQQCGDGGAGPGLGNDPENWRAEATGAEYARETGVYPGRGEMRGAERRVNWMKKTVQTTFRGGKGGLEAEKGWQGCLKCLEFARVRNDYGIASTGFEGAVTKCPY